MHPIYGEYYKKSYNIEWLFAKELEQKKKQKNYQHFADFFLISRVLISLFGREFYIKYFDKAFSIYRSWLFHFYLFFFFSKVIKTYTNSTHGIYASSSRFENAFISFLLLTCE